jgi:16S rRNA (guanine1207-N2)-methyltransferase
MAAVDDPQKTLFHPFDTGDIDPPGKGQRLLFLGAEPGFRLPEGFDAELTLVQGFKPDVMKLRASRYTVLPQAEGDGYDIALVLAGRHRGLNEGRLAEAIHRVMPGGLVLVGGSKEDGVAAFRARLEQRGVAANEMLVGNVPAPALVEGDMVQTYRSYHPWRGVVPLEGSLSKYHGIAFWLRRSPEAEAYAQTMRDWQSSWPLIDNRFRTAPGMFSHDRIDAGSALLAQHLPTDLSGVAADFCAGWGYLSTELLDRCPKIASLDLFEADHASLEAAKLNLADARVPVTFHWQDLASEPVARVYDAIVMNPPFHQGKAADPAIGNAMIRAASAAMKPNGRLWLVANRGLPYEPALAAGFKQSGELLRDGKFKLLWAKR